MVRSQKIILETNVAFRPVWRQCSIPLLKCSIQNTFVVQYFHRQNWKKSVGCMNFYQRQLLLLWKREDIFSICICLWSGCWSCHQRPLVEEVTAPVVKKTTTKTMQIAGRTMLATLKQIRITLRFLRSVKDNWNWRKNGQCRQYRCSGTEICVSLTL